MSQLLESIKINNGRVYNIAYHNKRCNEARKKLWGQKDLLNLRKHIVIPSNKKKGLYKCRIVYDQKVQSVTFTPYTYKPIKTLKLVYDDSIDYEYKYLDRNHLDQLFDKRGAQDDILIVKNGLITDTYYGNIILQSGKAFCTPKSPLLKGTYRTSLLDKKKISTRNIRVSDLKKYEQLFIVNALIPLGKMPVQIHNILF